MGCRHEGVIGLTVKEAEEFLASWSDYILRSHEENEIRFITADYVANRLNVTTKDGIIVSIEGFG